MTQQNYSVYADESHRPIFSWDSKVGPPEEQAMEQLRRVARLPIIHRHVAVMPDCHWGIGATIGSVIVTKNAVIPSAVGVDIGCGMTAEKTNLTSEDLPDNHQGLFDAISNAIPHGRTDHGQADDRGSWRQDVPNSILEVWHRHLAEGFEAICEDEPGIRQSNHVNHLGTLGTGNHFLELCLDETDRVWVMVHSGSRGVGNRIASLYMKRARQQFEDLMILDALPDPQLAYFAANSPQMMAYLKAVFWAQEFAYRSRDLMIRHTLMALETALDRRAVGVDRVDCHHNYVTIEHHFGENVYVTRKGAVRARERDLGIIPGSMGARSFIVQGLGNKESFHSCSHGAGRKMSRAKAKQTFSIAEHEAATQGVTCLKGEEVLDETPGAYKDIDDVMASQDDLVKVRHTLKQFVCIKGAS